MLISLVLCLSHKCEPGLNIAAVADSLGAELFFHLVDRLLPKVLDLDGGVQMFGLLGQGRAPRKSGALHFDRFFTFGPLVNNMLILSF